MLSIESQTVSEAVMRPLVEARTSHQPHGVESEGEIHHIKVDSYVTVLQLHVEQLVSKKLYITHYHHYSRRS